MKRRKICIYSSLIAIFLSACPAANTDDNSTKDESNKDVTVTPSESIPQSEPGSSPSEVSTGDVPSSSGETPSEVTPSTSESEIPSETTPIPSETNTEPTEISPSPSEETISPSPSETSDPTLTPLVTEETILPSSPELTPTPSDDDLDGYTIIKDISKRMPAEYEPVSMVKMCYPNNMPLSVYKTIAEDNKILLLVNPSYNGNSRINQARNALDNADVNLDNVTFLDMPIDDDYYYWVRDFSPFYVFNNLDLGIVDFTYNRPQRIEQNNVPYKLSTYFNMSYSKMDIVHTGGNQMQDGRFTSFSDDLVIQENDGDETKVRNQMKTYTGTENYVITIDPQGDYIAHIDCWGKIIAPDKIIVAKLPQSNPRYQYYEQVANQLANTKCIYGYNYKIYRIEEPGGETVAPYTNSLIANNHVYMPLGELDSYNEKAINVYKEALPGYEIHGIEGYDFDHSNSFLNTDALHCRTHEVPDKSMLFIDSREVYNGNVSKQDKYIIKTNITSYSKGDILEDNVIIKYSINDAPYVSSKMSRYEDTNNFTFVFKYLNSGDDVKYYIEAKDTNYYQAIDPTCGKLDPHHFVIS